MAFAEEKPSVDVTASTENNPSVYVAPLAEAAEPAVDMTPPPSTEKKQPPGEVTPSAEKNISGLIWSAEPPLAPIRWPSCRYILSLEMLLLSWMWSSLVAVALLEEALVSVDTMFCKFLVGFVALYSLNIVFLIAKWNAAALLVLWAISIAMVGFFGYCLAVHARYNHIRKRNQSAISASGSFSEDGPNKSNRQPLRLKKALGEEYQHVAGA